MLKVFFLLQTTALPHSEASAAVGAIPPFSSYIPGPPDYLLPVHHPKHPRHTRHPSPYSWEEATPPPERREAQSGDFLASVQYEQRVYPQYVMRHATSTPLKGSTPPSIAPPYPRTPSSSTAPNPRTPSSISSTGSSYRWPEMEGSDSMYSSSHGGLEQLPSAVGGAHSG